MDPQQENSEENKSSRGNIVTDLGKRRLSSFLGKKIATQAALTAGRAAATGLVTGAASTIEVWGPVVAVVAVLVVVVFLIVHSAGGPGGNFNNIDTPTTPSATLSRPITSPTLTPTPTPVLGP